MYTSNKLFGFFYLDPIYFLRNIYQSIFPIFSLMLCLFLSFSLFLLSSLCLFVLFVTFLRSILRFSWFTGFKRIKLTTIVWHWNSSTACLTRFFYNKETRRGALHWFPVICEYPRQDKLLLLSIKLFSKYSDNF